jgi:hypothetical protein
MMMPIARRVAAALGSSAMGVAALASPGPAPEAGTAVKAAAAPPDAAFGACGLRPVPLAGALLVQGTPVEASIAWSERPAQDVLACERAHFRSLPVDLQDVPGAIVVRDHHRQRVLLVWARDLAPGSTEVVRAVLRGAPLREVTPPAELSLPAGLVPVALVEDGAAGQRIRTWSGPCSGEPRSLLEAATRSLAAAGWSLQQPGTSVARVFTRRGDTLVVALAGAGGGCAFSARLVEGST